MKKFKFRLEPLLTLRKRKEDEEIRNLSVIVSEINLKTEEQSQLIREIQSVGNQISKKINTGASLKDYYEYSDVSRFLNLKISSLESEIEEKQPELDLARIRLNEATKNKKILELLKEKAYKEHKKKLQKEEKKEIEEYITLHSFLHDGGDFKPSQKTNVEPGEDWNLFEDEVTDWNDSDEVKKDEKELSEYEKLQKYYNDSTKR